MPFKIQFLNPVKFWNASVSSPEETESISQRKILKVAILGRPNVGKSTLINQILNLNVCDVSSKCHTTQFPLKTAFIRGDTQIIFVDTPGLVTKTEFESFELSKSFLNWKKSILQGVDIIGVMVDAFLIVEILKLSTYKFKYLDGLLKSKPAFLIWNKVDLVKNRNQLLKLVNAFGPSDNSDHPTELRNGMSFSKSFLISALKNEGVSDIVDYLLLQAKPKEWELQSHQIFDFPLHKLIVNLLRAKMLDILPQEIPYVSSYEVEYLEENQLGEIICVALISCRCLRHKKIIVEKRKKYLKTLIEELESDMYRILKKTVKLRVVVVSSEKSVKNVEELNV